MINEGIKIGADRMTIIEALSQEAVSLGLSMDDVAPILMLMIPLFESSIGAPPGTISMLSSVFEALDTRLGLSNSILKLSVRSISDGLLSALSHPVSLAMAGPIESPIAPFAVAAASIAMGYKMMMSKQMEVMNSEGFTKSELEAFRAGELLKKHIQQAEKKDKDFQMAVSMSEALKGNIPKSRRDAFQQEYELNALSILSRQLSDVLSGTGPLSEYSTYSAKRRALQELAPGRSSFINQGYPTSVIGIDKINFKRR